MRIMTVSFFCPKATKFEKRAIINEGVDET